MSGIFRGLPTLHPCKLAAIVEDGMKISYEAGPGPGHSCERLLRASIMIQSCILHAARTAKPIRAFSVRLVVVRGSTQRSSCLRAAIALHQQIQTANGRPSPRDSSFDISAAACMCRRPPLTCAMTARRPLSYTIPAVVLLVASAAAAAFELPFRLPLTSGFHARRLRQLDGEFLRHCCLSERSAASHRSRLWMGVQGSAIPRELAPSFGYRRRLLKPLF